MCLLWQGLSDGTMSWPWSWPLTYFKVKFVAERATTILWICLLCLKSGHYMFYYVSNLAIIWGFIMSQISPLYDVLVRLKSGLYILFYYVSNLAIIWCFITSQFWPLYDVLLCLKSGHYMMFYYVNCFSSGAFYSYGITLFGICLSLCGLSLL